MMQRQSSLNLSRVSPSKTSKVATRTFDCNLEQLKKLAKELAPLVAPRDILTLSGPLGAGKTTFSQLLGQALGVPIEEVSSPTFVILQIYQGRLPIYHFDLYRLHSVAELEAIGAEDYFWGDGCCLVEWPELAKDSLPPNQLELSLEYGDSPEQRRVQLTGSGTWTSRLDLLPPFERLG